MTVCVYCASSENLSAVYFDVARALGTALAGAGHVLVYGGGAVGLMGELARAVHRVHGYVCGVIPEVLRGREGIAYHLADELIVTETMQERKKHMFTRADAFVVLPGGIGTLEEFMEVLTLRALGYHDKPIVLLSTGGFYDGLAAFFREMGTQGFLRDDVFGLFTTVGTVEEAMRVLEESVA